MPGQGKVMFKLDMLKKPRSTAISWHTDMDPEHVRKRLLAGGYEHFEGNQYRDRAGADVVVIPNPEGKGSVIGYIGPNAEAILAYKLTSG
ncbi:MAG: hypothetical protein V1887_04095 [Candidatus Aenigmatarchaeota archaeon]